MQIYTITTLVALALVATAVPTTLHERDIDASLVPNFGIIAGQDNNGDTCAGANGVRIPCFCPPDRGDFISKVNSDVTGTPDIQGAPFPTGSDSDSQAVRLQTCVKSLQNFKGALGVGCPVASTSWVVVF